MEPFPRLEDLTLMDDYMFGTVMQDPKLIKPLIEFILDIRIKSVTCIEQPDLPFGDETVKVIVNTRGTVGEISDELREIIRYLDDGTVSGEYSRELEDAVNQVKSSEERRHEYMIMMVRERELIDQGIEQGIERGLERGRAEGREEGRAEGRVNERVETIRKLICNMHVSPQEAMSILDIPAGEQAAYLERLEGATT